VLWRGGAVREGRERPGAAADELDETTNTSCAALRCQEESDTGWREQREATH